LLGTFDHLGKECLGRDPVRTFQFHIVSQVLLDPGHSDLEELIQIRCTDGEKLQPLEKRQLLVTGEIEDPPMKLQKGEFAVDVQSRFSKGNRFSE